MLDDEGRGYLAWDVVIDVLGDGSVGPYRVQIDVVTGEQIAKIPLGSDALSRTIYSANNTTDDLATLLCIEGTTCTDTAAIELRALFGSVYGFWLAQFGRDSFDGAGHTVIGSIRNSDFVSNAGYILSTTGDTPTDPHRFMFGIGDGVNWVPVSTGSSPDFVSHEFAHGVSHAAIGLFFNTGHADANPINEGLSDVFAAVFDWYENGLSANTWKIFEDVYTPAPQYVSKAYRSMSDPVFDGASNDHYLDTPALDAHHRAGILNLAFNRLVVGGGHPHGQSPGIAVPGGGIGMDKASRIFYGALPTLGMAPSFKRLREETADAAADLYPSSSVERDAVQLAWDVVGVPGSPTAPVVVPNVPASPIEVLASCTTAGVNDIYWLPPSSGPTPDNYELQFSLTNSFTNPEQVYFGPEFSQVVVVVSTGWVRVRGCNAMGCGVWRGPKKVPFLQTCP